MLYRLSLLSCADRFILKGAALFRYWLPELHRPTLDIDLLGVGFHDVDELVKVFREAISVPVDDDGLVFVPETLQGSLIREGNQYHGVRILLDARLTSARLPLQFDIGFGDIVSPNPITMDLKPLLPFPHVKIATYSRYTTVAEKFQALVILGLRNSRMKDYFDIWTLSNHFSFDGDTLQKALKATFSRRNTPVLAELPVGLTAEFSEAQDKQAQWKGFLRRIGAKEEKHFPEIVKDISAFLSPVVNSIVTAKPFYFHWNPKGPWRKV